MLYAADIQHEHCAAAGFILFKKNVVVLVFGDEHGESANATVNAHVRLHLHVEFALAHCHKRGGVHVVEGDGSSVQDCLFVRKLVVFHVRVAHEAPFNVPAGVCKGEFTLGLLLEIALDLVEFIGGAVVSAGEPAVRAELHRREEHLSAQVVIGTPDVLLTEAQRQHVPVAVLITNKVAVADTLDYERRLVAVGEHGVVRVSLKRTPHGIRAGAGYHVAVFRAALGCHEVVCSVYLV